MLCEKPLTTDIVSAYAIVQKERTLGKQLIQVGFMRRFDAEYVALRKLIADGGLGKPLMVHCAHRNPAVGDHFTSEYMIRTPWCMRSTRSGSCWVRSSPASR